MTAAAKMVWVLLAACSGGPATRPAAAAETGPTTRPAGRLEGDLLRNLRTLAAEDLAPPAGVDSARVLKKVEALRRIRVIPRPRGRTVEHILAARRAAGGATTRPATPGDGAERAATTRPAKAAGSLPKAVLEQLKALPEAGLSRPIELADELYRSGLLEAAGALYERGVKSADDPNTQAWALFQLANCRRETDPAAAEALYGRVVGEHARSAWAAAAEAERKLLMWLRVNDPQALLTSIESVDRLLARPGAGPTSRPAASQPTTQPAGATSRPAASQPAVRTVAGTR